MPRSPEVNGFRHPQGVAREVEVELTPPEPCPVGVPAAPPGGEVVSKPEILEPLLRHLPPGSAGAKLDHSLADAGGVGAELHQHLGGDALALADQTEQQVLGAEVVVVAQPGFVLGKHNDPSSPVGEGSGHRPHSRNASAAPSHLARYTMASRTIPQIGPGGAGFDSRADSTRTGTASSHQDPATLAAATALRWLVAASPNARLRG